MTASEERESKIQRGRNRTNKENEPWVPSRTHEAYFPTLRVKPRFICSLSCDRSIASSTASSPPSATYCFLFQIQFQIFTFPTGHAVAVYVFFVLSSLYLTQLNFCEN